MQATKIWLKLYASAPLPDAPRFVSTFHEIIRKKSLAELMVDVVDYGHVHDGPRVLFVGHEGDYAVDHGEARPGLAYQRKRTSPPGDGSFAAHLGDSLLRLLDLSTRLVAEPELAGLSLGTSEIGLRIADRLHAPNASSTFDAVRGDLEGAAKKLWGENATVAFEPGDGTGMFAARLRAPSGTSTTLSELRGRVGA